jgi:hypothetical protein
MKFSDHVKRSVGDVYYLLQRNCRGITPQRSHPFTSFSNHSDAFQLPDGITWDVGFIVTVIEGSSWSHPWSGWLNNLEEGETHDRVFEAWGPYRSSTYGLFRELQDDPSESYMLLASGSGMGYILDVLGHLAAKRNGAKAPQFDIIYITRSTSLFQFVIGQAAKMLKVINQSENATVTMNAFLTAGGDPPEIQNWPHLSCFFGKRPDLEKLLNATSASVPVFFVGRPSIAEKIQAICNRKGLKFVKDFTGNNETKEDRTIFNRYFKAGIKTVIVIIIICVFSHLFLVANQIQLYLEGYNKVNVSEMINVTMTKMKMKLGFSNTL